ncbi:MAG: rhamnulokinase, partial [Clostridia bacterium]|nr:rhamnulokinase [Clostridia bacterium]
GLKDCTGKCYAHINVVGGGTKDGLLCAMTASSCGVPVYAGPIEATVLGNVAVQLLSLGELKDIAEARRVIAAGEHLKTFDPVDTAAWDEAYRTYLNVL